jgi:hypothetical protein
MIDGQVFGFWSVEGGISSFLAFSFWVTVPKKQPSLRCGTFLFSKNHLRPSELGLLIF